MSASDYGGRANRAPVRQSFNNPPIGTTPTFVLPAGVYELQYFPVDPNNPGTLTVNMPSTDGVANPTLQTGVGSFPGQTGCLWFITAGGAFSIATTVLAQSIVIYGDDN